MKNKIIFSCLIILLTSYLPLPAQKKPPQTPLKELTDPSSRYYVPYPYPKTEFEIIEDFKYALKRLLNPEAMQRKFRINGDLSDEKMLLKLINKKPSLYVTKIIRVENLVDTSPCLYNYLLQIEDLSGKIVAVGRLDDCGLFGAVTFFTGEIQFRPYKTEEQVKRILGGTLGDIEINKMERIWIHSSLPVHPFAPLLRVSSSEGTFFIDYYDDVYTIADVIPWTRNDAYPDPRHKRKIIFDGLQGKALFLKKVKTKRDSINKSTK